MAKRMGASDGLCEVNYINEERVAEARTSLPSERVLRRSAEAFAVLASPARLRILRALEDRELCVCDIAQLLGLSMSGTSQQLRKLRDLGAVDYRSEGKLAYHTLAEPFWLELAETLIARFGAPEVSRP